jgi:hypothetical protein
MKILSYACLTLRAPKNWQTFQLWLEQIEADVVLKKRSDRAVRLRRISLLLGAMRRWAHFAHITQGVVVNYKCKRMFVRWKNEMLLTRTRNLILRNWTAVSAKTRVDDSYRRWRVWCEISQEACAILARVAEQAASALPATST